MAEAEVIACRGGRTGRKVHLASPGSSVTHCGHWLKVQASYWRVTPPEPGSPTWCERCTGGGEG